MNKKLPFEEALERLLSNVPLPDQDTSWQKMQELLDKKKKRRFFGFFSLNTGCLAISFLLLAGICLLMYIMPVHDKPSGQKSIIHSGLHTKKGIPGTSYKKTFSPRSQPVTGSGAPDFKTTTHQPDLVHVTKPLTNKEHNPAQQVHPVKHTGREQNGWRRRTGGSNGLMGRKSGNGVRSNSPAPVIHTGMKANRLSNAGSPAMQEQFSFIDTSLVAMIDHTKGVNDLINDSTRKNRDSTGKDSTAKMIIARSFKKNHLSGGVGLQQPIPLAGQKPQPYGKNGKSYMTDYIPSLYIRFERKRAWFLQAEFSYAAPQLVKTFTYNRSAFIDSAAGYAITMGTNVKKIFYTQLPLSFNYYLRPHWSVGAGGAYSLFYSAVTEKETALRYLPSPSATVTKEIVPVTAKSDTSLFRSNAYVLVQANYHWRRLSAGLRFTRDIQPYIRYPLPDGTMANRRNWSLGFIIRFAVWKPEK